MPQGVAQRLLHDAVDGGAEQLAQLLGLRRDLEAVLDGGLAPATERHQVRDRFGETELGETDRPQAAEHAFDLRLQMADRLGDGPRIAGDRRRALFLEPARDVGGIDIDREQERSDLVVEIARQFAPLLLLQREQLLVQAMVLRRHPREPRRHLVEAVAQRRELRRQPPGETHAVVAAADAAERLGEAVERSQRAADDDIDQHHGGQREQRQDQEAVGEFVPDLQHLVVRHRLDRDLAGGAGKRERQRDARRRHADEAHEPVGDAGECGLLLDRRGLGAVAAEADAEMAVAGERRDEPPQVALRVVGLAQPGEAGADGLLRHRQRRAHLRLHRAPGVDAGDRAAEQQAKGEDHRHQADEPQAERDRTPLDDRRRAQ